MSPSLKNKSWQSLRSPTVPFDKMLVALAAEVSAPARDLLARLLLKDPAQRCTAAEALRHPWLTGGDLQA